MERRRFFQRCSSLLTTMTGAMLLIPGIGFLVDPLFRSRRTRRARRLMKLSDLQPGVPRKVPIMDQRVDAWTRYREGHVGAVWLRRGDGDKVQAFSVICPHLGCTVNHVAAEDTFACPCHAAKFAADGTIVSGPQQRGLDELEVTLETVRGEAWVNVAFERFQLGVPEKVSLG